MTLSTQPTSAVSLRRLLPDARILGADDIVVRSCAANSKLCLPDDLFVAMVGAHHDGHDFVDEAIANGASAILSERALPTTRPVCIVENAQSAYAKICQALAGDPSKRMRVIGVTGTNGKTTVCRLIQSIMETAGATVGMSSSLGYDNGYDRQPWDCDTPNAAVLADLLSRMEYNGCTHAVIEASSEALSRDRLDGIELDAVAITNLRQDHLDYHGSVANYHRAKKKILGRLRETGFAVVNADDPGCAKLLSHLETPALSVAMHGAGEITASVVERHKSEQTFLLSAGDETVPVCTRMIGDHHVYNCLVAAAVGLVYGVDLKTVVRGLERVDSIPGRMQRIECGQPFGVFVDQADTPDALAMALKALRRVTHGRLICVFGADAASDCSKRPLLGRVAERGADLSLITTAATGVQSPLEVIHDVLDGYERPARAHVMPDRAAAIEWALSEAQTGDTVLIAGRGAPNLRTLREEELPLDDVQIAQAWLYQDAPAAEEDPIDDGPVLLKFPRG